MDNVNNNNKWSIDFDTKTIIINGQLTTEDLAKITNKTVVYDRQVEGWPNCDYILWTLENNKSQT